jgi:hypothetical protein
MHTDRTLTTVDLEDSAAGPFRTSCWLICGGPSLGDLPMVEIAQSPLPKMCVNLAGFGLLRPDYWTSYDPTNRFLRSIYLDASIVKFVHKARGMDLVPETTYKVCESPQLYVFERDKSRGYQNFLDATAYHIVDWADSMVQAIDILYRLGFRRIYMAGCEMRVRPSAAMLSWGEKHGIQWNDQLLLKDYVSACQRQGLRLDHSAEATTAAQYHFDETKPLRAAMNTDTHYYRVAQYLRLSRRSISIAGVELISVTPESRLNAYFPYQEVGQVLEDCAREIGYPHLETTRGLYTQSHPNSTSIISNMKDYRPHGWDKQSPTTEKLTRKPKAEIEPKQSLWMKYCQNAEGVSLQIEELG